MVKLSRIILRVLLMFDIFKKSSHCVTPYICQIEHQILPLVCTVQDTFMQTCFDSITSTCRDEAIIARKKFDQFEEMFVNQPGYQECVRNSCGGEKFVQRSKNIMSFEVNPCEKFDVFDSGYDSELTESCDNITGIKEWKPQLKSEWRSKCEKSKEQKKEYEACGGEKQKICQEKYNVTGDDIPSEDEISTEMCEKFQPAFYCLDSAVPKSALCDKYQTRLQKLRSLCEYKPSAANILMASLVIEAILAIFIIFV